MVLCALWAACSESDMESSRRIKTEFLVQLDGAGTKSTDLVLVIGPSPTAAASVCRLPAWWSKILGVLLAGATNRPQELDEAARRRFVKRLYIPLPDEDARRQLVKHLLTANTNVISEDELEAIVRQSAGAMHSHTQTVAVCPLSSCIVCICGALCVVPNGLCRVKMWCQRVLDALLALWRCIAGYSGADVANLCKEAAMGPVRHGLMGIKDIASVTAASMPPITMKDFDDAFRHVGPSSQRDCWRMFHVRCVCWNAGSLKRCAQRVGGVPQVE